MTEQSTAAATPTTDAAAANAESTTATLVTDTAATKTDASTQTAPDTTQANSGKADEVTDKPAGAPEKYEFTPPEGTQVDAAYQTKFEGVARELNLTQEQANKLYALGSEMAQAQQKAFETALTQQSDQWAEASRTDKEIGGEKFDASVSVARKALATYATPELRTLLEQTRLGNHPEVLRLFHRIGTSIADDTLVNAASAGGSERKSAAQVLFDHPSSNPQR